MSIRGVDPKKLFFTSDTHYGHRWIAVDDHRAERMGLSGYQSDLTHLMGEELLRQHNAVVPPDGITFNIGDFTYTSAEEGIGILGRMHGLKYLVMGNHDFLFNNEFHVGNIFPSAWDGVYESRLELNLTNLDLSEYPNCKGTELMIVLDHYPMEEWNHAWRGAWHLHGHCHAKFCLDVPNPKFTRYDVGVDSRDRLPRRYMLEGATSFAPFSLDELIRLTPGPVEYSKTFRA
jgi:calcineurin-like phosphoesterase family protein